MKGSSDGNPTPIGEWGNDKTGRRSHVLIAVIEGGLDLLDRATSISAIILTIVVTELLLPVEVIDVVHIVSLKLLNDVSSVHILSDQSGKDRSLEILKFTTNEVSKISELGLVGVVPSGQSLWVILHEANCLLSLVAPLDHGGRSNDLTSMLQDPLLSRRLSIGESLVSLLELLYESGLHFILNLTEPSFSVFLSFDRL